MNKFFFSLFVMLLFSSLVLADSKAVIEKIEISVDDVEFRPYDSATGKGVVAIISDDDGLPGGIKTFNSFAGDSKAFSNFKTQNYNYYTKADTQWVKYQNGIPIVNSNQHSRIYIRGTVKNLGSSTLNNVYIHPYVSYPKENLYPYGMNRHKKIETINPGETKESIISFDIANFPEGYFYARYQFGTWWHIWYDSLDYQQENHNVYCPTCVWPWFSKPLVYFTGSEYNFPEIKLLNADPSNLFGEPIITDGSKTYSADFQVKNTKSNSQNILYYQTLYAWWPNQYNFRFDPFWKVSGVTKTLSPGESFTSSVSTSFTTATQQQLLGSYFYLYLKNNQDKVIPLGQYFWNNAGYEKDKFLYVWYSTPQVTVGDDGTPTLKNIYGLYKHTFYDSSADIEINPDDMQIQFKVIRTIDNVAIVDKTLDIDNHFCHSIGTGSGQDNKVEVWVKPTNPDADLMFSIHGRMKNSYVWKTVGLTAGSSYNGHNWWGLTKTKKLNEFPNEDGWYHVTLDLINDFGLRQGDLSCNIIMLPHDGDFLIDDFKLISTVDNTNAILLDEHQDLLSGQYAWWGNWKEPIKISEVRALADDYESFKISQSNALYIVDHWLRSDIELPITPDDLDKNYLLQVITKKNGVNNWYRGTYFTATPLLSSLDQNTEVHLCPAKGLNTFYRRNLIFNGQDYNVYPDITATEYSDTSDTTRGIVENDPYVFVPAKGGSTTYVKYVYTDSPSLDLNKNLNVKVSYYDELMNEIKDEKSIPIHIYDNNGDSSYCTDYMDITPLEINVRKIFLNYDNEVKVTVANIGNLDSTNFNVKLIGYESSTSNQIYSQTKSISVQGGEEKVIVFDIKPTDNNYMQYDFSVIVDPENNLAETNPHKKGNTLESVAEINNQIKAYKVPVYEYDASTEFFEGYDEENDKRMHFIMSNRGNTESLMENTIDYENLYSSGTYNSFPSTIDILLGNFDDATIDLDKVNTLLEVSDTINNFDIYGTDSSVIVSNGATDGQGKMVETSNNFLIDKRLWSDIDIIESGIYQISSMSEIINDILESNNLSEKEYDICNEKIVGDFMVSSNIEQPMLLWESTDTLLASFNINTNVEEFIEFRVEIDCPIELDCKIMVPNDGLFSFTDPINNYIDINVYADIKVRNNVCPVNQNYNINFRVIYSSHLDVCVQEFTDEFDFILNLNSGGYCQCEIGLNTEFTGECTTLGQDNCYAELDEMCCGDDENELWNYEFEQCEQIVDNILCEEGSCDSDTKEVCLNNVWNSDAYCDSCTDSTCGGTCDISNPCDTNTKSICEIGTWQNPLFENYCEVCGESDSDCSSVIDTCNQDLCDVNNKKYCNNNEWVELNYCDKCLLVDSSCTNQRQICEELRQGEQGLCNLETETDCWDGVQCCEESNNEFWSIEYDTCDPTELATHEVVEIDNGDIQDLIDELNNQDSDGDGVPDICESSPELCLDSDGDGVPDVVNPDAVGLEDSGEINPNDNPLACEIAIDNLQGVCDSSGEYGCWDESLPIGSQCCWTDFGCTVDTLGNACCDNSLLGRTTYLLSSDADKSENFCNELCGINNPTLISPDCFDELGAGSKACCGNNNDETWNYLSNDEYFCINGEFVDDPDNSALACALNFGNEVINICTSNFDENCYDDVQNSCCGDDGISDTWVNIISPFNSTACIYGVYMIDPDQYKEDSLKSLKYCAELRNYYFPSLIGTETWCNSNGETYCTINTDLTDDLVDKNNLCCGDDELETNEYSPSKKLSNLAPNLCHSGSWLVTNGTALTYYYEVSAN